MDRCPYHRSIVLNGAGTHQVCSLCWQPGDHRLARQTVYPTDVVQYLRERGTGDPRSAAPQSGLPSATRSQASAGALPDPGLPPSKSAGISTASGRKFVLRAAHSDRERALFWYVNRRFLGRTVNQHRLAVSLEPGAQSLEVVDAHRLSGPHPVFT